MDAINEAETDASVKVILITGKGDFFSSGNDLSNFSQLMHPRQVAYQAKLVCIDFVDSFINGKKPLVCALNGPAFGIAATTLGHFFRYKKYKICRYLTN